MNVEQFGDTGGRLRLLCFMPEGCPVQDLVK
jgi:hypothetical protein